MINWDRISELQEEVGEDGFAEVLSMFFEEVDEAVAGLSATGPESLKSGLHFLKGAALNIGMSEVSEICQAAEQAIADGNESVDVQPVRNAIEASKAELRDMLG